MRRSRRSSACRRERSSPASTTGCVPCEMRWRSLDMTVEGCREWRERLGAYVLGQLTKDERAATSAHIEGCAACRAEAESLAPLAELLPIADPAQLAAA